MSKPTEYKVVRTKSPPMYFESFSDAIDNSELGIEDTHIVPLYAGPIIPTKDQTNENLIKQVEELNLLVKLMREHPEQANNIIRQENDARCARYGCDDENQLQWKWRHVETLPAEFDYQECEAALLDAFIRQGGATVWCGDGSGCAMQIVEAVWKRMKAAEDKVKELQTPKLEPVGNQEIQNRIGELQNEIMALTYKVLGNPGQSVTFGPEGAIFNPWSTKPQGEGQI
jgi:hypothetical protein